MSKAIVNRLIAEWEFNNFESRGKTVEELCKDHPELLPEVSCKLEKMREAAAMQTLRTIGADSFMLSTDGQFMVRPTDDDLIFDVSRYRDMTFLARGGVGEVFTAEDEELKRHVAIKFIRKAKEKNEVHRLQFAVEGEITARLEHPGVVPVYGIGNTTEGRAFQVMRLIRGESLREAIAGHFGKRSVSSKQIEDDENVDAERPRDILTRRQLLARFVSVCQTIAYAHTRGVIHRDIKPENVMLGQYGETLVVDWGLAIPFEKKTDSESDQETLRIDSVEALKSTSTGVSGTPSYMSPEQAMGLADVNASSDIYSLGSTLYELLTGSVPFSAGRAADVVARVRHGEFEKPSIVNSDVPPALEAICLKAMSRNPAHRYTTASDMARDVEAWMAGERVVAYTENRWEKIQRWAKEHRRLAQTLMTTLLLLVVGLSAWSTAAVLHRGTLIEQRMTSLVSQANLKERLLTDHVENLRQDILLLSRRPQLEAAANVLESGTISEAERSALAADFEAILGLNPGYMQVRLIGSDGREKVRVDRETVGGQPFQLTESALQDKGGKAYFRDTRELSKGEVYLSEININMEQGQHQWDTPTIRAAAPVLSDDDGRFLGAVVVNMHFGRIVDALSSSDTDEKLLVYLTDDDGRFLLFPKTKDVAFCFERGLQFDVESLYTELRNFLSAERVHDIRGTDVSPQPSVLIATNSENEQQLKTINKLGDQMMGDHAANVRVRATRYEGADHGRSMLVATAQSGEMLAAFQQIAESGGLTFHELAWSTQESNQSLYARKVFFDPSRPDRYLCLVLALPH